VTEVQAAASEIAAAGSSRNRIVRTILLHQHVEAIDTILRATTG